MNTIKSNIRKLISFYTVYANKLSDYQYNGPTVQETNLASPLYSSSTATMDTS